MTKVEIFEEVIAKVKANEELTKKFITAFNEGNLAPVVKEMGYDFPVEELIAYIDEKEENMDLSEMATVAGGGCLGLCQKLCQDECGDACLHDVGCKRNDCRRDGWVCPEN